ncbi:hypothetical protein HAX54_025402, partial [Datura stramonium]|nr:hypothetical protein [Datura stramonium]
MANSSVLNTRHSSKRLKRSSSSPSYVEISDSSSEETPESSSTLVKKPLSSFSKKESPDSPLSFDLENMQKFWS